MYPYSNVAYVAYNYDNMGIMRNNPTARVEIQPRPRVVAPPKYTPNEERTAEPPRYSSFHDAAYATAGQSIENVNNEDTTVAQ